MSPLYDPLVEIDRHRAERDVWRAVAVALAARLAEEVSDPDCPASLAYNAARNDRMDQAREWLT